MFTPRNGVPFNQKLGMQDNSVQRAVAQAIGDPIHKPLIFTFSAKGDTNEAYPVAGGNLTNKFGAEMLDPRSKYATFNTPYAQLFNSLGNEMMVQRLETPDGKTATARAEMEVIKTEVDIYEKDGSGDVVIGSDGNPKVASKREGLKIIHRIVPIEEAKGGFGQGKKYDGSVTGTSGETSKVYPLYDVVAPYYGEAANGFGWTIEVLHSESSSPVESDMQESVGSRIYRFEAFEQLEAGAKPVNWPMLNGGREFKFALKEGAYYNDLRLDLDYRELLPGAYRNMTPQIGMLPEDGIFKDFHFYHDHFEEVVELMKTHGTDGALPMPEDIYMVDIFGGVNVHGQPYDGIVVNPSDATKVANYSANTVHYMQGGSDGTISNEVYDTLVRQEMTVFGWGKVKYDNELKYGLGILYDSGFSFDTKEKLVNFILNQKSTFLVLSTHLHGKHNDEQEEEAAKVAVASMLSIAPESIYYGTGSGARAMLVSQAYKLNNSTYKPLVPLTYTLARLLSNYAGSKDPRFNPTKGFSRGEHTIITEGTDLNLTYKPMSTYSTDWDLGVIAARSFDYHRFFLPAISTAFKDGRSVLRNGLFTFAMSWIERVSNQVWAECSGESTLSDSQYAKLVEDKIIAKIQGRLDNIATIRPHVYFTEEDKRNGNTATVDLYAEGQPLKTQHKTTIKVSRPSEE